MEQVKTGDTEALRMLIETHQLRVVGTVAKMLGDDSDAEDIAQQVFIRVWNSATRYRPTAKFTTWLFKITRNLVFNELRRRKRHPTASLDGKAVRRLLVGTAELMAAFVCVDPQLHVRGLELGQQLGVEDEEAGIGRAVVVELIVHHRRPLAAHRPAAIQLQLAPGDDMGVAADVADVFLRCGTGPHGRPAAGKQRQRQKRTTHRQPRLPRIGT